MQCDILENLAKTILHHRSCFHAVIYNPFHDFMFTNDLTFVNLICMVTCNQRGLECQQEIFFISSLICVNIPPPALLSLQFKLKSFDVHTNNAAWRCRTKIV